MKAEREEQERIRAKEISAMEEEQRGSAIMEEERRKKLEERKKEEVEMVERERQRHAASAARQAAAKHEKMREKQKLLEERAALDAELDKIRKESERARLHAGEGMGGQNMNAGSNTERVIAAAREALGESETAVKRRSMTPPGISPQEYRRLWAPRNGSHSPQLVLDIIKRRLLHAGQLSHNMHAANARAPPRERLASQRKASHHTQLSKAPHHTQINTSLQVKRNQAHNQRREVSETECWDAQATRYKTPGPLSRSEPSPYSYIPAILQFQQAGRLKRLLDTQVTVGQTRR